MIYRKRLTLINRVIVATLLLLAAISLLNTPQLAHKYTSLSDLTVLYTLTILSVIIPFTMVFFKLFKIEKDPIKKIMNK